MSIFHGGANMADPDEGLGGNASFAGGTGRGSNFLFEQTGGAITSSLAVLVTVRRFTGVTPGVPAAGVPDLPLWRNTDVEAYVYAITPKDVMESGGLYAEGDIILGLEERAIRSLDGQIRGSQAESNAEGDRVIFPNHVDAPELQLEYRVIGQVEFVPFTARNIVYKIHCRKLGLAE